MCKKTYPPLEAATGMNTVLEFQRPSPIVYSLHRRKLYSNHIPITRTIGITGRVQLLLTVLVIILNVSKTTVYSAKTLI